MQIAAASNLACPIDGLPLSSSEATGNKLACERNHSYDPAREGYINLLLVQHKSSRNPGDGRDMVAARRRVHAAGIYAPVADHLFDVVRGLANEPRDRALHIVDAGCGEGYYLRRLAEQAAASPDAGDLALAGVDISKFAVQAAARKRDVVTWVVANNRHLPFVAGTVDLIISMFG